VELRPLGSPFDLLRSFLGRRVTADFHHDPSFFDGCSFALFRESLGRSNIPEKIHLAALHGKISVISISDRIPQKNLRLEITEMKNWQRERNYRRIRDEYGTVIANIITVDGVDVAVTEEVFLAYSQADRRERYVAEEVEAGRLLSLDLLLEQGTSLEKLGIDPEESVETTFIDQQSAQEWMRMKQGLLLALHTLKEADFKLIVALSYDGISTREYARRIGVTQGAVIKRRDRIFRDLKNFLKNFPIEGNHLLIIREGE
jgi:DNA-directed RNA polymerase specialized sigma24 family protein